MRAITITKYVVGFLLVGALAVGGYATYVKLPTGTDIELSKAPKERLRELLAIVDSNSATINNNIYVSSAYQPDNPLYEAVVEIQRKNWSKAVKLLTPMAMQGNAEAMYWLGEITYSTSAFSDGGKWFLQSASLGNPYAAIKLSPQYNISNDCQLWLRNYCDNKWGKEGLEKLKNLASNGDIKARYAYLFYTRFENTGSDFFNQLVKVAKEGVDNHYYRPLRQLTHMYQTRKSLNPYSNDVVPLTEEDQQQLIKLLMVAANNNDVFSIHILDNYFSKDLVPQTSISEAIKRVTTNRESTPIIFIDEVEGAREYHEGSVL